MNLEKIKDMMNFNTLLTPKLITVLWIIYGGLVIFLNLFQATAIVVYLDFQENLQAFVIHLLLIPLLLAVGRVILEMIVVVFKIHEELRAD